jgi:hypothetical protein
MARIVRFREYGDASVLKIENLDVPPPGADEVQIDVKSIGLNQAQVMCRTHAYLQEAQFPSRLGYEAAGIAKTVGTSVTSFKKGDVVSLIPPPDIARWNTYGELANVLARNLVKHPRNISFEEAAASGCSISLHGALSLSRPSSPRAISSSSQRHPAVSVLARSKLQSCGRDSYRNHSDPSQEGSAH